MDGSAIPHPDDLAVDRFAAEMKRKLAAAREKGRAGWNDPKQCSQADLSGDLRIHTSKGDPVDVANFAMMLWARGECILRCLPLVTSHLKFDQLTRNIDIHQELLAERTELERRRERDRRTEPRENAGRRGSDRREYND